MYPLALSNLNVTDSGNLFWSGTKRFPSAIEFDAGDHLHMDFIVAAANLRAFMLKVPVNNDEAHIREVLDATIIPDFQIDEKAKIQVTHTRSVCSSWCVGGVGGWVVRQPRRLIFLLCLCASPHLSRHIFFFFGLDEGERES